HLPRALHGDLRIVTDDAHAQRERRVRDLHADRAEAYDAERPGRQLEADELLLRRLDLLRQHLVRLLVEAADVVPGLHQVTRGDEEAREHELLHGVRVRPGRVEYRHAAPAELGDRNIVHAGARAADREHARRNLHLM